jgi:16S rRNA G1207 methylase RsmC
VALSLQKRTPNCELFLLDSHTRAIEVSRINAEQNGLPVPNLACSSQGWPEEASFDVFIGNPPYFGDHQISGLFIDTAADCLDEGGVMWIVAKSMDWNRDYAEEHFEKIEVFQRRGYGVMKAIRKSKSI